MSDENEIELEGGFLDEAGIDGNDIPDDPFNFGNDYWPVRVIKVGKPKVTAGGDKIGITVVFAVDHPRYQNSFVSGERGLGNSWYQVPVPLALRSQIPWDPEGEKEQQALYNLKELYKALGFKKDEFGSVSGAKMLNRGMLTKIKVGRNAEGFWDFRLNASKPFGEGSDAGMGEFTNNGTSNPVSAAEQLKKEMDEI